MAIPAARGSVFDRNGAALVVSVRAPSVFAHPALIQDADAAAARLAPVLNQPAPRLRKRLARGGGFVFLARWVSEETSRRVAALSIPGVGITDEPRRRYPLGELAAQVLGFSNIDGDGVRGVERLEDHWLRGDRQTVAVERDAKRRALAPGRLAPELGTGGDIALTLDAGTQAHVERALERVVESSRARGGIAVLIDPRTGDILALAERPTFNPNRFRDVPFRATRARSWADALEPGSTLKPFLVAAAIESGVISEESEIDCGKGSYRLPGKTLRDARAMGMLSISDVLRFSSNIGAAKIGFALGAEQHYASLRAFGFGEKTGSGLPGESAGLLRNWRDWRAVDHATISFGHGVSVTALQLASAMGALAHAGVWREPRLVAARKRDDGSWQEEPPGLSRRSTSPEASSAVSAMLAAAVGPGGTGASAAVAGAAIAGKTGTAQKFDAKRGRYADDRHLAWFAGTARVEDHQLVGVIMLDEPKGRAHTGGAIAAPLFAEIIEREFLRRGYASGGRAATGVAATGAGERTSGDAG
jgi:cell division protein FtsI (penicillin-binding protein 3)